MWTVEWNKGGPGTTVMPQGGRARSQPSTAFFLQQRALQTFLRSSKSPSLCLLSVGLGRDEV